MTENVTFRAEYSAHIDGEKVASTYKAYADEGQPYCIVADTGGDDISILVQMPSAYLDDELTAAEAEELDRRNAIEWVELLAELVEKARLYDDLMDAMDGAGEYADPDFDDDFEDFEDGDASNRIIATDSLAALDPEEGAIWRDVDGDYYQWDKGKWHISYGSPDDFEPVQLNATLTNHGPYERVEDDGSSPYVVAALGPEEEDAVWEDRDGDQYKVIKGMWHFKRRSLPDWQLLDDDEDYMLSRYAPYRVVVDA